MHPPLDEKLYQTVEGWGWDKKKVMVNRLVTTVQNAGNIITFICTEQLLEPMRPLVTFLQCKKVYFNSLNVKDAII